MASLPGKAVEVLNSFEKLWREAPKHWKLTAPYLSTAAGILGDYLVALSLSRRYDKAAKLLREHGQLLGENPMVDVATRLALRLLGIAAEPPSNEEVLEAVWGDVRPWMLPALATALEVEWRGDVAEYCNGFVGDERKLCHNAYQAVIGDSAAEGEFVQWARNALAEVGFPEELLKRADVRRLVEVLAPIGSLARFILLMRALNSGDVDTARLHAEVGSAALRGKALRRLFGKLAEALHRNNQEALRAAVAKLYYYHL